MLFTGRELLDIVLTVVAASFIFSELFSHVRREQTLGQRMLLAAAVVGPAIVLHEFGHKFVALALGLDATFRAAYLWLAVGIALRAFSFPFIFLVPAYVAVIGVATPLEYAWIAGAGPAINGLLALGSFLALKFGTWSSRTTVILAGSQYVNLFLMVFNLLPIPGFDGASFWGGLWTTFF